MCNIYTLNSNNDKKKNLFVVSHSNDHVQYTTKGALAVVTTTFYVENRQVLIVPDFVEVVVVRHVLGRTKVLWCSRPQLS